MNRHELFPSSLSGAALQARIEALAAFSDVPGEVTRLYLSPAFKASLALVEGWMREAGLKVHLDGTGSLLGYLTCGKADAPLLVLGSHIDTVRNAGKYDGTLGVITAIGVVEALKARGIRLDFDILVAAFGDEEGVRFASTLAGSKALAGRFDAACLDEVDGEGVTRRQALAACGAAQAPIKALEARRVLGYVEVHIEQGPVLEAEGLALGVVSAINGACRGSIFIEGFAGHAGTLPMAMRRDAVSAAAEIILAIESIARATPGLVATVGQVEVPGGAVNTVAGHVRLSLDIRAPEDDIRDGALEQIRAVIARIAAARGISARMEMPYQAAATPCAPHLMDGLAAAVQKQGRKAFHLPSGAGHDAMAFRGVLPVAMLFVRCKGGISHNPAEYAAPADMEAGARSLFDFVCDLKIERDA